MGIFDSRAPMTVRLAAVLFVIGGVGMFVLQLGVGEPLQSDSIDARFRPLPQLLSLGLAVWDAWLLGRLNGLIYGFNVVITGLGAAFLVVAGALGGLGVIETVPGAFGNPVLWFCGTLLIALFALLIAGPSRRAPWGLLQGFPQKSVARR